jgi:spermidine synthase
MHRLSYLVFFVSGFAALLYQVIWQRILAIFSGADVYSATIIVAAFMAGLGIGSLTGGHVADRVAPRTNLILFGVAELAIAGFALLSARLYYDVLYARLGSTDLPAVPLATILFTSLLWPTFFMGVSLPLLARSLTTRLERAAATIGTLYGLNTLGAAAGALVATWWLLPHFGLEGSLRVGAALNAAAALVVLMAAFVPASGGPITGASAASAAVAQGASPVESGPLAARADERRLRFWVWAVIYGFAGCLALSLEIVWFRALGVMLKSTAFTFGTLLAMYLAGLGCGSLAGGRLARLPRHALVFLGLQAAAGLSATGLLAVFVALIDDTRALRGYFSSYEPINVPESVQYFRQLFGNAAVGQAVGVPANFLRFYVGVPLILVVPPTFLMGCSFPVLQRVVQTDLAFVGRRVGVLLVANVAGSVLGAIMTGWFLLNVLGTPGTLKLLGTISVLFAVLAAGLMARSGDVTAKPRMPSVVAVLVVGIALVGLLSMPAGTEFWARLHGSTPDRVLVQEDGSGLAVLKVNEPGRQHIVFVNGLGQSTIPYGNIHTALGAVPSFLHPAPRTAAIIGLGSGDTLHAVAGRPDFERITSIEIIRPQLATLERLHQHWPYGGLQSLLSDTRIHHVFGDGRIHLMRGGRTYDIIEADALRPGSAYSGNLYSKEYFTLVRDRLAPNGLAATWAPTRRVHDTFLSVFPYVLGLPGMLVGSSSPIRVDRAAVAARVADPRVQAYYRRAGIDVERLLNDYLSAPVSYTPQSSRDTLTDLNTDLFPKDEYDLAFGGR